MNYQPNIIIVEPQMAENIGAVARCMKNFGLTKLRLVKPRCAWPDLKAFPVSAGADDILHEAIIYQSFDEAIKDLNYLYAVTARKRYMNKEHITSKFFLHDVSQKQAENFSIGIVFGRESNGLTNAEVNVCNKLLTIDTNENFGSLNIAQAVCIIAYELFGTRVRHDLVNQQKVCTKDELEGFFQHLITGLEGGNFFKLGSKREHMIQNIKNIFSRIENLSSNEVQTLRGIIVALSRQKRDL
jgi:tRNA/rRNA methyltransferase